MEDNFDLSKLKKKKKVNSNKKGNVFANKIAKLLNERFNTKEFSKTPGSGAYATTHSLPEHLKIYGDLIVPKDFRFCIECKKGYNKESLYSLLNPKSKVWEWIEQNERDAASASQDSLIIIQQDRQPIIALMRADLIPKNDGDDRKIFFGNFVILPLDAVLSYSLDWFYRTKVKS